MNAATGGVRRVAVPPALRTQSALSRIDYADAFVVEIDSAGQRTAEKWARDILERASRGVGGTLWSAFAALGVLPRGGGAAPDQLVAGWELRRSVPGFALFGASSALGLSAELLFERDERTLLWATFVRFGNPGARVAWAGLAPVHRRVVLRLLEHARLRSRTSPAATSA